MHAYASDDPVFLAMNARGQRETGGELGAFCVNCHAPMAVRDGLTADGLNLDEVPRAYKGVTCYFCHTVAEVAGEHDNPLRLAEDGVMRGGFGDAIASDGHRTGYSRLLDRNATESSAMCGSCHDIVTPAGVHIERTYAEYKESAFPLYEPSPLSCGDCHTQSYVEEPIADVEGAPPRRRHEHTFPGIDTALTEWPGKDLQLAGIARDLRSLLQPKVCYDPSGNQVEVRLTNIFAGHMWPSGAAQDRRAWVELQVFTGDAATYRSGVVPPGGSPTELVDRDLWLLRDRAFDADGEPVHMFWDIASVESELLPPSATVAAMDHSVLHRYPLGAAPPPDRIELRVFIQAVGRDVLDDLIASGDLASHFRDAIPTHQVGQTFEWSADRAGVDRCLP
jgi:hypothetical protein